MKSTGICPKCNSNQVYTNKDNLRRGDRCKIPIKGMYSQFAEVYVCLDCGFIEEYLSFDSFIEKNVKRIKEKWTKVKN